MAEKLFMIALSPTMEEGTILKWIKSEGDFVNNGDIICEVETDKASMEYESVQEGTILKILVDEGSGAKIGDVIAIIGEKGEKIDLLLKEISNVSNLSESTSSALKPQPSMETKAASASIIQTETPIGAPGSTRIRISPLARKLATRQGIEISTISGSGPNGRIVKRDVENYTPMTSVSSSMAAGQDIMIPVSGKRSLIAKRLSESKFTAPHYYVKSSVTLDNLIAARAMLNAELPEKVGFNAFMLKFAAEAMKRYPGINASWQEENILQFGSIDIGLAVDLGNGLITPIVRNVGHKGIVQIDAELKTLIDKTREGHLKPEEYTGATFSISNLGSFGVDEFTAIINPPGSAILALGKVNTVPVYDGNSVLKPVKKMIMTLSCDHRVIDGALAARFITEMQSMMENPVRALF